MPKDRVKSILRGARPAERFIVLALSKLLDEDQLEETLKEFRGGGGKDMGGIVAGKPFVHWYGKTTDDLKASGLSDEDVEAIVAAHAERGLEVSEPVDEDENLAPAVGVSGVPKKKTVRRSSKRTEADEDLGST